MTRIQQVMSDRMDRIRKGDSEKGFTLIELLVVIIIIGILAAIAVPVFLSVREGAWKSSVESDVHNTQLAVEQYAIENNGSVTGFPATDVVESDENNIDVTVVDASTYTIAGTNNNLGVDAAHTYTFDSATGAGTWP
jgi:type IV pilus assembly protein PilA